MGLMFAPVAERTCNERSQPMVGVADHDIGDCAAHAIEDLPGSWPTLLANMSEVMIVRRQPAHQE
jgi:hypothetical protein